MHTHCTLHSVLIMCRVACRHPQSPEEVLTFALKAFPRLMPWEVALACGIRSSQSDHPDHDGPHDRTVYVTYVSKLLSNKEPVQCGIVREVLGCDADLLTLSLTALLEGAGHSHDHTHTEEGQPRMGSHMIEWAEPQCLQALMDMCCALEVKEHLQTALKACQRTGYVQCKCIILCMCTYIIWCRYWLGVAQLLVTMGDKKSALSVLLALGDIKLLTQPQPWGKCMEITLQFK